MPAVARVPQGADEPAWARQPARRRPAGGEPAGLARASEAAATAGRRARDRAGRRRAGGAGGRCGRGPGHGERRPDRNAPGRAERRSRARSCSGAFAIGADRRVAKILDITGAARVGVFEPARRDASAHGSRRRHCGTRRSSGLGDRARRLVTFDVAGQEFALPLDVGAGDRAGARRCVTAVPRAEAVVLGMTSVRDTLLPLLSLRGLLGFAPSTSTSSGREKVVVMAVGGALVGLVADRARAIVAADPTLDRARCRRCWRRAPAASRGSRRSIAAMAADG